MNIKHANIAMLGATAYKVACLNVMEFVRLIATPQIATYMSQIKVAFGGLALELTSATANTTEIRQLSAIAD